MSPTGASAAAPALAADDLLPARLLDEGELIILALRPHPLSVLLVSLPVIAVAGLIALGVFVTQAFFSISLPGQSILLFCMVAVLLRLQLESFQWAGRLYLLTTRRVLWVNGISKFNVVQCPLARIQQVRLAVTAPERVLALGSICFTFGESPSHAAAWVNINKPAFVMKAVTAAIDRAAGRS